MEFDEELIIPDKSVSLADGAITVMGWQSVPNETSFARCLLNALAEEYRKLAEKEEGVIFGGRLGQYKYYDMAPVIEQVLKMEIK